MKMLLSLLVVALIGVGAWFYFFAEPPQDTNDNGTATSTLSYRSTEYGVSFTHPFDWLVSEASLFGTPAINVYAPGQEEQPPYIHHNNVTNVSIFPDGVPTEGLFAPTRPLALNLPFSATGTMFVLNDGTPFAAYIRPLERPTSWGEAGFIWMRVGISDLESTCYDAAGTELAENACDPMTEDHEIRWSGTVDASEWQKLLAILRTLTLE